MKLKNRRRKSFTICEKHKHLPFVTNEELTICEVYCTDTCMRAYRHKGQRVVVLH